MKENKIPFIVIFVTSIISVFYFCLNVNSWKFSFVGDEWSFYLKAVEIAKSNFLINPFSLDGVWGQNPVTFSMYQAIFIKLLGANNFAWRISTILLLVPMSLFFFLWIKQLFDWRVAMISTLVMQTSFYLANFLKIGYPNPFSLTLFIISIHILNLFSINLDKKLAFFLGIILGISFYIYIGILFPLMLIPYFIVLFWKKYSIKKLFAPSLFIVLSYSIILIPFFIQISHSDTYLKIITEKTILKKEYSNYFQPILNVFNNLILFFRNNDYNQNHFVTGPYLDYFSQIFTLLGIGYILKNLKNKSFLLLLIMFLSTAFVIGITSPYSYSPTTRGIFFLPFGFAFTGLGIDMLLRKMSKKHYWKIFIPIIITIFSLNFYKSQVGVFKKYVFEPTALIVKYLQEEKKKKSKKITYLIIPENNNYNYQNIEILRQAYGLNEIKFSVKKVNKITCEELKNINIIIFKENENILNSIKKQSCGINVLVI